ncbi:uncharacterized protein [Nicotiana sylvestris]|uniref:uncharacterized protein n=1 Tax=Nicotiana sylvestris TaxID=4096 RepID=UPI00388C60F2
MKFTREELYTVPIWIRLPGSDFKYWSPKGLSKIGSLVGKPLMIDNNTKKKTGLNFSRVLIEVEMEAQLPNKVWFKNEKGALIEQKVIYDWKPGLCKFWEKEAETKNAKAQQAATTSNLASKTRKQQQQSEENVKSPKQMNGKIKSKINDGWITPMYTMYAFNNREERKELWNYLNITCQGCQETWIIMGDFNAVLRLDDKVGGLPITVGETRAFQECVDTCGLIEMSQHGNMYSWNERSGDQRIFSKIDWAFVNRDWLDRMPKYNAIFLPARVTDHCPISVHLVNAPLPRKKPFKFCNIWSQHPQFLEIVKEGWDSQIEGCVMLQVVRKLELLKRKLKGLKQGDIRTLVDEVNGLREELQQI